MTANAGVITVRAGQLLGAMQINLAHLVELEKTDPAGVMVIVDALVRHLRSWKPMAALPVAPPTDTGPIAKIDPVDVAVPDFPTEGIARTIRNGRVEIYRLRLLGEPHRGEIYVHEDTGGHDASGVVIAEDVKGLIEDLTKLYASLGGK